MSDDYGTDEPIEYIEKYGHHHFQETPCGDCVKDAITIMENHSKIIAAKDKEITEDKTYISGLENIVKEQKKEIERLKEKIKDRDELIEQYMKDGAR